jgi:uncharacterized membrane protein YcaP (DUF421 family)
LGWIADYFFIVREIRWFCQKGRKLETYFKKYPLVLIDPGKLEECLKEWVENDEEG